MHFCTAVRFIEYVFVKQSRKHSKLNNAPELNLAPKANFYGDCIFFGALSQLINQNKAISRPK